MIKIDIQKLLKDYNNINIFTNDSYFQSYPYFISYFENICQINKNNLIIGGHFVYGWMPTVLSLNLEQVNQVLWLLNAAKDGYILEEKELEIIKKCINNSMVWASKLLHFINPRDYAIWDSRIYRYISWKSTSYGIDKTHLYLEYNEEIKKISQHEHGIYLYEKISEMVPYKITPLRAIEILMFESDRQLNQ